MNEARWGSEKFSSDSLRKTKNLQKICEALPQGWPLPIYNF